MRFVIFGLLSLLLSDVGHAATLVGQQVTPGGKIEIRFPVSKYFQDIASQAGNPRPETGRAVLAFPAGFDPARAWPILIVTSTSDFNRTSAMDADWYRAPATAEGWLVLGPDATSAPRIDSTQWRLGLLGAALEAIRKGGRKPRGGRSRSPAFPADRNEAVCSASCWRKAARFAPADSS
jgi:hypothetical protein